MNTSTPLSDACLYLAQALSAIKVAIDQSTSETEKKDLREVSKSIARAKAYIKEQI